MTQSNFLDIVDKVIAEEMVAITDLIKTEIDPLVQYRKNLENKISTQAIAEMYKLEQEATQFVEKRKAVKWLQG